MSQSNPLPNHPLPFPPDPQQIELMAQVYDAGNHAIASDGSERYELFEALIEGGYMRKVLCRPKSLNVHQFSVTEQGLELITRSGS